MSRHLDIPRLEPSSPPVTTSPTPTTSTDHLVVHRPPPAYMQEKQGGVSLKSGEGSATRRSIASSHEPPCDVVRTSDPPPDITYTAPAGPRPRQPSQNQLSASRRTSIEHAPSITPSALEAGHAKDMQSSQTHRQQDGGDESDRTHRDKVWPPWEREDGWIGWRHEWVKKEALVVPLVVQAFSAGVLDATTYADFMTFASNQTGNTILLCVSVAGTVEVIIKLTAISLGAFLTAAFIFGHLGHHFGLRQRGWIIATTIWQILTLLLAAILVSPHGPAIFHIGGTHEWFILFLFAHMSGAQVAQARQSSNQELPTAPMTSSYVDLMSEKYLFVGFRHKKAGPRNRKLAYTLSMIVGGLLGAVIHRFAGSWEVVVVTMLLKVVMLGLVCRAKADDKSS